MPLLERLASTPPRDGQPGKIAGTAGQLPFATKSGNELAEEINPFRRDLPPAITSRDMWPPLVIAACVVFLSDIFIRRVQLDFTALGERIRAWVSRRKVVQTPATLERLSAKKAEIRERYQPPLNDSPSTSEQPAVVAKPPTAVQTKPAEKQEPIQEETMTGRLLAAKKAMKDNQWRRD
jgi:hypothetical protein